MKLSSLARVLWVGGTMMLLPMACAIQGPAAGSETDAGGGGTEDATTGSGESSTGSGDSTDSSSSSGMMAEPECPYEGPPPLDVSTLPSCPNCGGGAHCIPNGLVPADFADQLAECDENNLCVPDEFIETNGLLIPETCQSVGGAEGRCLNTCLPQVAAQADALSQGSCNEFQVCVPCFDPLDSSETGACSLSCDPGPVSEPTPLPKCCGGIGTCVPEAAVGANASELGKDGCSQDYGDALCAPDIFVNDPNWQGAERCNTSLVSAVLGDQYLQGACLPECLPAVDNFLIQQDGCPENFVCAPCAKPPFGTDSGACDFLANPY